MLIFMLNERKSEKAAGASGQAPLGVVSYPDPNVRKHYRLGHSKCDCSFPSGPFTKTHAGGRLLSIIYIQLLKMNTIIMMQSYITLMQSYVMSKRRHN